MDTRRSNRLSLSGYYNIEGGRPVSYKETPVRTGGKARRSPERETKVLRYVPGADVASTSGTSGPKRVTWASSVGSVSTASTTHRSASILKLYRTRTRVYNTSNTSRSPIRFLLWLLLSLFLIAPVIYGLGMYWSSSLLDSPVLPPKPDMDFNRFEDPLQQMRVQQDEVLHLQDLNQRPLGVATMTNFALESNGARVLVEHSSETYRPKYSCDIFGMIRLPCNVREELKKPNAAAQGKPAVGRCWPFVGDRGHLVVSLSNPVTISHVTLGHISKDLTPTGTIPSAPKSFAVIGLKSADDEGTLLGTFVYDQDGDAVQTFQLPDQEKGFFSHVRLQVESNWGEPAYTCLYDFRVHGSVQE